MNLVESFSTLRVSLAIALSLNAGITAIIAVFTTVVLPAFTSASTTIFGVYAFVRTIVSGRFRISLSIAFALDASITAVIAVFTAVVLPAFPSTHTTVARNKTRCRSPVSRSSLYTRKRSSQE